MPDVVPTSQSVKELEPVTRQMWFRLEAVAAALGLPLHIILTTRSPEDQEKEYADGDSRVRAWGSWHQHRRAIDFAFEREDGEPTWDAPIEKWQLIGLAAEQIGFVWGGRWPTLRDYGHVENSAGYKIDRANKRVVEA